MLTFRVLSALLSYPTPALKTEADEAERILRSEGILAGPHLERTCAFLRELQAMPQLDAESAYIDAFDRGRSTSLYLFEHIHGESRDRGQAMVRLLARYRAQGLRLQSRELPDFLPLFLEFLSACPADQAHKYLSEVADIIALIGQRLRKRGAPHAVLLEAVVALLPEGAQAQPAPAGESGEDRDDTPAALDRAWEEAPVTFGDVAPAPARLPPGAAIQNRPAGMKRP